MTGHYLQRRERSSVGGPSSLPAASRRLRLGAVVVLLLIITALDECQCLSAIGRQKRRQRGLAQQGKTIASSTSITNSNKAKSTIPAGTVVVSLESPSLDIEANPSVFSPQTVQQQQQQQLQVENDPAQEREILWGMAGQTSRRKRQRGKLSFLDRPDEEPRKTDYADPTVVEGNALSVAQDLANWVKPEDIQKVQLILPRTNGQNDVDDSKAKNSTNNIMADVTFVNGTIMRGINPRELHQRTDNAVWMALRQELDVTASELGAVVGNSVFTSRETLAQKKACIILVNSSSTFTGNLKACEWGLKMEPKAFRQYCEATGNAVQETGLHIRPLVADELLLLVSSSPNNSSSTTTTSSSHRHRPILVGASPDGLVIDRQDGSSGLLEIKCLWGRRHKKELPKFDHCPNRFFDQIQGQMAVCDLEWCDLMMYIPPQTKTGNAKSRRGRAAAAAAATPRGKNYCILRVPRDRDYWSGTLLPAVQSFCLEVDALRQQQQQQEVTTNVESTA